LSETPNGLQHHRPSELFSLLPTAIAGGSTFGRHRWLGWQSDGLRQFAGRNQRQSGPAEQQLQQVVAVLAGLRSAPKAKVFVSASGFNRRLSQSLHLINSADIQSKLATTNGRAETSGERRQTSRDQNSRTVPGGVLARASCGEELKAALQYLSEPQLDAAVNPIDAQKTARENFQDLIWA